MKNKIGDLNNYLFAQLERIDDDNLTNEALETEYKRGRAMAGIAAQIISGANVQLKAVAVAKELGLEVKPPAMLGILGEEPK